MFTSHCAHKDSLGVSSGWSEEELMEHLHTDILVIGWGKGGKTLAGKLGRAGREVTLVEASEQMVGGTCINVACVPTKPLVTSASRRRAGDDASDWFAQSIDSRDALVTKLRAANHAMLDTVDAVRLVSGHATFVGPKQVCVQAGDEELEISAEVVLINTGTLPKRPPIDGANDSRVFDSTTIQHADPRPEELVIVGAGPIGLEFAGMFRDFGTDVTENVWAIGDVHGGPQQTYLSLDDARIIGAQLAAGAGRSTRDRVAVPTTVFTSPPFATVGMTEAEARDAGHSILVAKKEVASIAAAPRPKILGDPRGLVKFVVDAETDLVLGARLLVVDAQELINLIALAMRAGVTASELRDGIWTHPSTTELLNEVLAELSPA